MMAQKEYLCSSLRDISRHDDFIFEFEYAILLLAFKLTHMYTPIIKVYCMLRRMDQLISSAQINSWEAK